jgi:multidrug transporter EmrE-like cation transporter
MIWLIIAYFANGLAQFFQKSFQAHGLGAYVLSGLIMMYCAGIVLGIPLHLIFRGKISRTELVFGFGVGICSFVGNFSIIQALKYLPAYTVFPIAIGGAIVVVAICSWLFFGEQLSTSAKWGIVCGTVAIGLLTIR